ncbi:MAG: DUF4342 domain-containing protein [Anaerolineae bacterium]|nr:DUF4342 domain-containing protein [Anaerolineae bacterium]
MAESREPHGNGKNEEPATEAGRTWTEELEVAGSDLLKTVENLIHEGNVRRVIVKQDGRVLFDLPLTVVAVATVVTAFWAPFLAALGGVAGLALMASGRFTLVVERTETKPQEGPPPSSKTKIDVEGGEE